MPNKSSTQGWAFKISNALMSEIYVQFINNELVDLLDDVTYFFVLTLLSTL